MDQHQAISIVEKCKQAVEAWGERYQVPQHLVQMVLDCLIKMFNYAKARLGNEEEALSAIEDAVANVFAFIARGNQVQFLDHFLWRTLRNEISSVFRQRKRSKTTTCPEEVLDSVVAVGPSPEEIAMKQEPLDRLERRINKLDITLRQAILAYLEGLPGAEAARRLGWNHTTYRTRVLRAKLELGAE